MVMDRIADAFSMAWHGRKTAAKQLDVILEKVELWPAGHEYEGVRFLVPHYHLSLKCAQTPAEIPIGNGGCKTVIGHFEAIIEASILSKETAEQLQPGAQLAVRAGLCRDGRGWGTAFVTHDGLGMHFYDLTDLQVGPASKPVNPAEVLVPLYTFPLRRAGQGLDCQP